MSVGCTGAGQAVLTAGRAGAARRKKKEAESGGNDTAVTARRAVQAARYCPKNGATMRS